MSSPRISRILPASCLLFAFVCLLLVNRFTLLATREAVAAGAPGSLREVVYVPETRLLQVMFLGYDQAAADTLWLRMLGYFGQHVTSDRQYPWLEFFIEQIIQLDPRFQKVYHWAGANVLYGRVFTNENVLSSNHFYELALRRDPEDTEAAYRLGINFYVEMHSDNPEEKRRFEEKGVEYLEMAANMPGASPEIRSLVASLYRKLGRHDLAVQNLLELLQATEEPAQREDLLTRLRSLKENVDLSALTTEAEAFEKAWRERYSYVPVGLFLLLDGAGHERQGDVDWQSLVPDVVAGGADPAEDLP